MKGVIVGIVFTDDGDTCVGMKVGDAPTLALPVGYAAHVFEQLGLVLEQLEQLGAGGSEEGSEIEDEDQDGEWLQ